MNLPISLNVVLFILTLMMHRFSVKMCPWLVWNLSCHAPAFVTQGITWQRTYVMQIKICAEYRDMLPRPRLVCQEPGLRSIGRSPGVPDKSSRCLSSMSRYSAHILICIHSKHFLIFLFLCGFGLPSCTVPSAIVHCTQNGAGHQTIKAPSKPCWGAACPWKHYLAFMPQDRWNWPIKWIKSLL